MARLALAASLATLLALMLYLPAALPPERFVEQVRIEHDLTASVRGPQYALRVLDRTLGLGNEFTSARSPFAKAEAAPVSTPADAALASELAATSDRLLGNRYFASAEAMLAMALYRLAALVESLPLALVFGLAALVDGLLRRAVKSKQFEHHHPEIFGACGLLILLSIVATMLASIAPFTLHPLLIASVPLVLIVLAAVAAANFHSRG